MLNQINLECDDSKYTDTISYYDGMGPALYRLCKYESSLKFFDESLSKDPLNVEILTNKGSAHGKLGNFNEAIINYDKAIQVDSYFLPALNNKANLLASKGNFDEAISLYTKALEKNPDYSTAQLNLEYVLSKTSQKNHEIIQIQMALPEKSPEILEPPEIIDQVRPQKEKTSNFFDHVDSVFSAFVSLFEISK